MDTFSVNMESHKVDKNKTVKVEPPAKTLILPVISIKDESDSQIRMVSASRSCSFRHKPRPIFLQLDNEVIRRHSMPQPSQRRISSSFNDLRQEPLKRVRSFKMTSKGIVNKGDSFRRESDASITSTGSTKTDDTSNSSEYARNRLLSDTSEGAESFASFASSSLPGYYQVILLGSSGVGKSALAKQFMTSEYIGSIDCDEYDEAQLVSVHLDGEESTLEFIDVSDTPEALESINADAYVVVFSVNDRSSFNEAVSILGHLRHVMGSDRATILVANKIDLARKRIVSAKEARYFAEEYGCKYAETSVTLNHQVDELLVGIIQQIRLKLHIDPRDESCRDHVKRLSLSAPKSLFYKLLRKNDRNSKSCDNLYMI